MPYRDSAGAQVGGNGQGLTITTPGTVQVGDWGFVGTMAGGGSNASAAPAGWSTLVADTQINTGAARLAIYGRQFQAGDANPTVGYPTAPASGNNISAFGIWYSGVTAVNVGTLGTGAAALTRDCPSLTTGGASREVLCISGSKGSGSGFPSSLSFGPDATFRGARYATANFYPSIGGGDFTKATAGATNIQTATWNFSTANSFGIQLELVGVASNVAPTANAGPDQTVDSFATVTLTGAASSDSDGAIASYAWSQVSGTAVTLSGSGATRTFTAPANSAGTSLVFGLTVTDNGGATSTQDNMAVTVLPHVEWLMTAGGLVAVRRG